MTPLSFVARIAALVLPRRIPLVRYSGAVAPASKWRAQIVPRERRQSASTKSRLQRPLREPYVDWAGLLKHSMGSDVLSCPR